MANDMGAASAAANAVIPDVSWKERIDAAFRLSETTARNLETQRIEADKRAKEADISMADLKKTVKKTSEGIAKLEKSVKELTANMGGVNNALGMWAEALFRSQLWEKFAVLGYEFTKGGPSEFKANGEVIAEVDVFLENGDIVMAVEVKSQVKEEHIIEHLERIEKLREYLEARNDRRKIHGAIAGMVFSDDMRRKTMKAGLFAIVPSGDTSMIVKTPKGWAPKEW